MSTETERPELGVNHLTVVPTNLERAGGAADGGSGDGSDAE